MNLFILTQEEPFYLPTFFHAFLSHRHEDINIVGASVFPPFNSQANWFEVLKGYFRFYGLSTFIIQSWYFTWYKLLNLFSSLLPLMRFYSVHHAFSHHEIPIVKTENLHHSEFLRLLKQELKVELIISVACPKILRSSILTLPKYGCINFHNGYLPRYRGINPLFWSMLHGEKKTAISIHYMNTRIDDGDIIVQKEIPIEKSDSLDSLYKKVLQNGPSLLWEAVCAIHNNHVSLIKNDSEKATYFGFPSYLDGKRFREQGLKFR